MFQGLRTVVYHVENLESARDWYAATLGIAPYFDTPYYVGFNVGGYELGLHPREMETTKLKPVVPYWGVPDAEAALAHLLAAGATPHEAIFDVGEGIKLGAVIDPAGNVLGVIENPHFKLSE